MHDHALVHCGSDDELFPQSSSTGPSCGFDETLSVFFHLMQPGRVEVCVVFEVLEFLDVVLMSWVIALIVKWSRLSQPRSCSLWLR